MGIPKVRAASKIVVPAGATTSRPSMVSLISGASINRVAVESSSIAYACPWKQTPAEQNFLLRCSSIIAGKCFRTEAMGACTIWPRPQIDANFIAFVRSSRVSRSVGELLPFVQLVSRETIFCDPTRQGTHLPQDSLRKKRTALRAMSSMHRPSAHTTMAPEPTIEPAAATALKSRGRLTISAGRYPDEGPEGAKPSSLRLSLTPPAYW